MFGEEHAVETGFFGDGRRFQDLFPALNNVARVGWALGPEEQSELHAATRCISNTVTRSFVRIIPLVIIILDGIVTIYTPRSGSVKANAPVARIR
jgi:hypothetical protein